MARAAGRDGVMPDWTIFSSHGMVLFFVAANPDATLRETAAALGLTERRVAGIVRDLAGVGMIRVERRGRRNHYIVDPAVYLRHPALSHVTLGRIAGALRESDSTDA